MSYNKPDFKEKYDNYIGGEWTPPVGGEYFDDISSVDGKAMGRVARSNDKDIDVAVAAGWKAAEQWGRTSATDRSNLLLRIAETGGI